MSSFSLPSAGGVVSLLNDVKQTKSNADSKAEEGGEKRPSLSERLSSGSSSTFSNRSSSLYASSSNGTAGIGSLASTMTSVTNSSTDSLEANKLAEIHLLRKKMEDSGVLKRNEPGIKDVNEEERKPSKKRRSEELPSRPRQFSSSSDDQSEHVLDHNRLAASPKPINGTINEDSADIKNVPMNMHKATSMSEEDVSNTKMDSRTTNSQSNGPRETSLESSSQSTGGKRRYPCSHPGCGKTFSTSGHAARHNRIHTGSKPYRCTFPGCNASFSRQDNSLQHYRTHVLHPKSRSNGGGSSSIEHGNGSMDATGRSDSSSIESHLQGLDAKTEATVRMGRKALEEGTAIAVVHEVVDGNGRRGEAVQRMVGLPKGSRRESVSTNRSDARDHAAPPYKGHGDEGEDDEDSTSVGTSWNYGNNIGHTYSQQQHTPGSGQSEFFSYGPPPATSSPFVNMTYPPPNGSSTHGGGLYSNYRPRLYNQASPSYYHSPQYLASKSNIGTYDRSGQESPNYPPHPGLNSNRAATVAAHQFHSATTMHYDAPRRPSTTSSFDHKRTHSLGAKQGLRPAFEYDLESRRNMGDVHLINSKASSNLGPLNNKESSDRVLSLLPVSLSESSSLSSPALQSGMRSRAGMDSMRLPLPSVSKLPYSSDRSTTALTPTTPLDEATSLVPPPLGGKSFIASNSASLPPLQNDGRLLPPLLNTSRK